MPTLAFWPTEVPPQQHPDHERKLQSWLSDFIDPEVRSHLVLQRHLPVLLFYARHAAKARLDASRTAYSRLRAECQSLVAPETMAASLVALEVLGRKHRDIAQFLDEMWLQHVG